MRRLGRFHRTGNGRTGTPPLRSAPRTLGARESPSHNLASWSHSSPRQPSGRGAIAEAGSRSRRRCPPCRLGSHWCRSPKNSGRSGGRQGGRCRSAGRARCPAWPGRHRSRPAGGRVLPCIGGGEFSGGSPVHSPSTSVSTGLAPTGQRSDQGPYCLEGSFLGIGS